MLFINPIVSLAFTLSLLLSVTPVWSSAALAPKYPILPRMANQSTTGVSLASDTKKYFAEAVCTSHDKQIEHESWLDALQYAQALDRWQPNGSFQPAMDLYMGNDSRGELGAIIRGMTSAPRQDTIVLTLFTKLLANIDGAVRVHNLSTWPEHQRAFVFCNEPTNFPKKGGKCERPNALGSLIAYS